MRIGIANEAAYILLIAFTAIMDAALKERIAARMEDGMVRLIAGMHSIMWTDCRRTRTFNLVPCAIHDAQCVGWRSDTHHASAQGLMGFAIALPILRHSASITPTTPFPAHD
jgi:hypothetical protein